jgi:hypothetical protein
VVLQHFEFFVLTLLVRVTPPTMGVFILQITAFLAPTFIAAATILPLNIATTLPRGNSEHVLLCNCVDSKGAKSSQMAYYSGDVSGSPSSTTVTNTGRTTIWEGAEVSAKFSDGNRFTSNIPGTVPEGTCAGTAKNDYGSFYCHKSSRSNLYTANGATCSSIYDCNHSACDTSVPGDTVQIYYSINSDYVELALDRDWDPVSILWPIWDRRVNEAAVDLGSGCSISFSGHGNDDWLTTNGLSQTLVSVVAKQSGLTQRWETSIDDCTKWCGTSQGSYCCDTQKKTYRHFKMAKSVSIYATNTASKSDCGELHYTLSCNAPAGDCALAKVLQAALAVAALVPEVGTAFSAVVAAFGIARAPSGC